MAKKEAPLPYDYSGVQVDAPKASDDAMSRITELANKMRDLDKQAADIELQLKKIQENRRQIAEEQLPALFASVGVEEFKTISGVPLKLKNRVHVNVSKGKKPGIIEWLDENGHGGMVRRNVVIEFDKTQQEAVNKLIKLIGRGWPNHRTQLDVNAATVKAFVTNRLKEGEEVPAETFGLHCVDVVEITSK